MHSLKLICETGDCLVKMLRELSDIGNWGSNWCALQRSEDETIILATTAEDKKLGNKPFLIAAQKSMYLFSNAWWMYLIFLLHHVFLCWATALMSW